MCLGQIKTKTQNENIEGSQENQESEIANPDIYSCPI